MSAEAIEIESGEQFGSREAREEAAHLGMTVFLATEILLFAALFASYSLYRYLHPDLFAQARAHMNVPLGTLNTFLLLISSTVVALSLWAVRAGRNGMGFILLVVAAAIGVGFLVVKTVEYAGHVREGALPGSWYHLASFDRPGASLYFTLYYLMTGVHAVHVAVGVVALLVMAMRVASRGIDVRYVTPLELTGMYWHLVDVFWLFIWPLLYLA